MYKQQFVVDADSLIKLAKAGLIKDVSKSFKCVITEEVYREAVVEGKKRLYRDAFKIEKLVEEGLIKIRKSTKAKSIEFSENLGEGEKSIYLLYEELKTAIIVSDDNTFLNFLRKRNAEFIAPAEFIILSKTTGQYVRNAKHF